MNWSGHSGPVTGLLLCWSHLQKKPKLFNYIVTTTVWKGGWKKKTQNQQNKTTFFISALIEVISYKLLTSLFHCQVFGNIQVIYMTECYSYPGDGKLTSNTLKTDWKVSILFLVMSDKGQSKFLEAQPQKKIQRTRTSNVHHILQDFTAYMFSLHITRTNNPNTKILWQRVLLNTESQGA